jgi:cbb3-type cytochrome oxidase subunit 3
LPASSSTTSLQPFDATDRHVKNAETSDLIGASQIFFSTFGLAVLFLLAGAGVQFALRKRSRATFLRERTARLLVPFVLPVYVVHQPVILAVAFFAVQWPLAILPKWLGVIGVSLPVTLALVELALRTPVTRFLLGARARPAGAVVAAAAIRAGPSQPGAVEPIAGTRHARPR